MIPFNFLYWNLKCILILNRRTSATLSAENGASALEMQQKHNWKNPAMALEYISNTKVHREKMAEKIQGINLNKSTSDQPGTSLEILPDEPPTKKVKCEEDKNIVLSQSVESTTGPVFKFFSGCNVTINVQKWIKWIIDF